VVVSALLVLRRTSAAMPLRERKRLKLERTGDSPQKKSEPANKTEGQDVEEAAQQASAGLLANGGWYQG
jgi:hypothetical protein